MPPALVPVLVIMYRRLVQFVPHPIVENKFIQHYFLFIALFLCNCFSVYFKKNFDFVFKIFYAKSF